MEIVLGHCCLTQIIHPSETSATHSGRFLTSGLQNTTVPYSSLKLVLAAHSLLRPHKAAQLTQSQEPLDSSVLAEYTNSRDLSHGIHCTRFCNRL